MHRVRRAEESDGGVPAGRSEERDALRGFPRDLPRARRRTVGVRRLAAWAVLVCAILLALTLTLALVYRFVTPPSTLMLGRWLTGQPVARQTVPIEDISPALVRAVFAAEDQRMCQHEGVDWYALRYVIEEESGGRGASTITMQTVKNVFLWPGRSYLRKALELPLAMLADLVWGKRRTMEIYLNVAEWGDGVFGAEAAARHWFRKSARSLGQSEANRLAAILPNPIERSATKPSPDVAAKAARIQAAQAWIDDYMGCLGPGLGPR